MLLTALRSDAAVGFPDDHGEQLLTAENWQPVQWCGGPEPRHPWGDGATGPIHEEGRDGQRTALSATWRASF